MGTETQSGDLFTYTGSNSRRNDLKTSYTGSLIVSSTRNNSNDVLVEITAIDNAGNKTVEQKALSIDITAPTINIGYDNNAPLNDKYYRGNRTATVTITERNFNASDVDIRITNADGAVPTISEFTRYGGSGNGDDTTYTAYITYSADGAYTFDMSYKDRAGNQAAV